MKYNLADLRTCRNYQVRQAVLIEATLGAA
ncbi:hypothetical protein ACVIWV_001535 [Bradyrhizobium diazoefficiens]|nr:hypothetical protein [Bradyrhizobium japonicum]